MNINAYYNDVAIFNFIKNNTNLLTGTVLDIGCGKMRYKKTILDSGAKKYIGLDLDEGKFTYSVKADMYWDGIKIPLQDESIDNVLLSEVLEHCPNPEIVIKEAFRVIRKGGNILITVPFVYQIHGSPYDFHRMTPYFLKKLLSDFSEVNIKPSGGYDASLAQMIGIWSTHRPMNKILRKILKIPSKILFLFLIWLDRKSKYNSIEENFIMPGLLITAKK